jgi:hypothetical protein
VGVERNIRKKLKSVVCGKNFEKTTLLENLNFGKKKPNFG